MDDSDWKEILGPNLIVTSDYKEIPKLIAQTILKFQESTDSISAKVNVNSDKTEEITIL